MNILITGAHGFVGKNLVEALKNIRDGKDRTRKVGTDINIFEYCRDTAPELLNEYCAKADFVFHLAGVNRPQNEEEFIQGNFGFTSTLLDMLKKWGNKCPVMISSSIQAERDNPYGRSKLAGEKLMRAYSEETGAKILIYRFPNVFGKWCKPNYNSAVATFCYNRANDLPITVNDRTTVMNLVYIDDVVDELIRALTGDENRLGDFCAVPIVHTTTLGEIVDLIEIFREQPQSLVMP